MVDFSQARVTMVDTQVRPNDVTRLPVIDAMLRVPRHAFVPDALKPMAYAGENLPLGTDRVMLEPRTLGKMLDTLAPEPEEVILDIGCGTGYVTALLAAVAQKVVGVEADATRVEAANAVLAELGTENATVIAAPLPDGAAAHGPYDAIVISGGAVEALPDTLVAQLREGGRVVALFREDNLGVVRLGTCHDGRMTWRDAFNAGAPLLAEFTRPRGFLF